MDRSSNQKTCNSKRVEIDGVKNKDIVDQVKDILNRR